METIFTLILSGAWIALELVGLLFFSGAFLPSSSECSRNKAFLYGTAAWLLINAYANLPIGDIFSQLLTFAVWFSFSMLVYRGKWIVTALLVLVYYVFSLAFDAGLSYGMCVMLDVTFSEYVWRIRTFVTVTTLGKLLPVLISWFLFQYRRENTIRSLSGRYILLILLFPIISGAMVLILFYSSKNAPDLSTTVVLFCFALVVANAGLLYTIVSIAKSEYQAREVSLLRQQMELQTENYNALDTAYTQQRRSSHEFKRHISTVTGLLEDHDADAALHYLHNLSSDRSLRVFSIRSNNPVVDVILNQKYQHAQEKNIRMHIEVNDLSHIPICSRDLVVLLSNILDNAMEACEQLSSGREIICRVVSDESLFISVRNTSLPVTLDGDRIQTTKSDVREHGYGIPAVTYILKQLKAEYTFDYEDGWFQFAAEIDT